MREEGQLLMVLLGGSDRMRFATVELLGRFKARLVTRGFIQVHGQDYSNTFAPTVRMDMLRLFLTLVASENLTCSQFDTKNTFTEFHLKDIICMSALEEVEVKKGDGLI